jgi:hypothetical protein
MVNATDVPTVAGSNPPILTLMEYPRSGELVESLDLTLAHTVVKVMRDFVLVWHLMRPFHSFSGEGSRRLAHRQEARFLNWNGRKIAE